MLENRISKILDEEHLLESANDSARHFRNVYLAYLTVMIYIFIIVLSTDQDLLFRAGDKRLPLVHISVPIVAFFIWMPWALLVLHFYLLIEVKFLADRVRFYKQGLYAHLRSREDVRKAKMLLASLPLVRILVEEKANLKHAMLYLIVFVSLVVFPLIVLIVTQIKFLPYQNEVITMVHRIVILIDVFLLWYFGRYILRSHEGKTVWINSIAGLLGIITLVFVFIFINFPGSKIYSPVTASFYEVEWVHEIMPNHFHLPNRKLEEEPAPDLLTAHIKEQTDDETVIELEAPIWCQYAEPFDLKNRNLRKAQLREAALCKAILQEADLRSADLREANLRSASLGSANLRSASLGGANLTSADFRRANLTSADFRRANLTSASLLRANLRSADLREANLRSADLREADLTSADLREADLTSASLGSANLRSASLGGANLTSADFRRADLTDANLGSADLTDVSLEGANLTSASLGGANLTDAFLSFANLSKTNFSNAVLDDRTTLNFTWVLESSGSEAEANFPIGIPRGWDDTLKPKYLCPLGFDIFRILSEDERGRRISFEQLMEENCKPYKP